MISQSKSSKRFYLILGLAPIVAVLLAFLVHDSCVYKHSVILDALVNLGEYHEPVFCESLLHDIIKFNEECEPEVEIIDCS